jgi:hypothetical protein
VDLRHAELLLLEVDVGDVVVGVGHARVDARRLAVGRQGHVELFQVAVDDAEVVIALRPARIELDALAQGGDGVVVLLEAVVDGAEVDERPRPGGVEAGDFEEVVGGAVQVVEQKADGRQAVVQFGVVAENAEGLVIKLPRLLVLALGEGLLRPLAKVFHGVGHGVVPSVNGGRWKSSHRIVKEL